MPRSYHKHAHGFINLMDDRVCFTRSGNWQEAEQAPERTAGKTALHGVHVAIGAALVLGGGLVIGLNESSHFGYSFMLTVGLIGLGCFKLYNELRFDFGPSFHVPFPKVKAIEPTHDGFVLRFLNGALQEDFIKIGTSPEALQDLQARLEASRR